MAEQELEDDFSCTVCQEDFAESDQQVPRLLPCSHCFCTKCVGEILRDKTLVCPQCRKKHRAESGLVSFPQNKYILASLKGRNQEKEQRKKFCDKLKGVQDKLYQGKSSMITLKENMKHKFVACQQKITEKKERLEKLLNEAKEKVRAQNETVEKLIDTELAAFNADILVVEKMQNKVSTGKVPVLDLVDDYIELGDMDKKISQKANERKTRKFIWYEYVEGKDEDEKNCFGKLRRIEAGSEQIENTKSGLATSNVSVVEEDIAGSRTSPLRFKDIRTFSPGYDDQRCDTFIFHPLCDRTMVIVGGVDSKGKTIGRHTLLGNCLDSARLGDYPTGMAEVVLGGRRVIALSYGSGKRVEFRDANNLTKIRFNLSAAPHEPHQVCSVSPTMLLYVDESKRPYTQAHFLDCSGVTPVRKGRLTSFTVAGPKVHDMCVVQYDDEDLLAVVSADLSVFNVKTDKLLWQTSFRVNGRSITADGRGRLFVIESYVTMYGSKKSIVKIYHVSDGRPLGNVAINGIESPSWLRWNHLTAEMFVGKKEKYSEEAHINVLQMG